VIATSKFKIFQCRITIFIVFQKKDIWTRVDYAITRRRGGGFLSVYRESF
jgi:hypothetical protein